MDSKRDDENQLLKELKQNVIDFLNELIEQFPEETDLIWGRIWVETQVSALKLMTNFIQKILPYRDRIDKEDDAFFLDNAGEFIASDKLGKIGHLKMIWKSSKLDVEDRKIIWQWFKAFLFIVDRYVALKTGGVKG